MLWPARPATGATRSSFCRVLHWLPSMNAPTAVGMLSVYSQSVIFSRSTQLTRLRDTPCLSHAVSEHLTSQLSGLRTA